MTVAITEDMTSEKKSPRFSKKAVMLFIVPILLAFALDKALVAAQPYFWIKVNLTPSLPGYIYVVKGQEPINCGDTVAFEVTADNKFYPGKHWIKKLMGCPGDTVTTQGRDIFVNGVYAGTAKQYSSTGRILEKTKDVTIPDGYYYAWAPHHDSYDSRYASMGLVSKDIIIGKAHRIF